MDDKIRRAEELLEQRARERGGNGHANVDTEGPAAEQPAAVSPEGQKTEELTNDLKRMTADFANYRKRNEAERTEFAKFAKADLISKILDVLDGFDRALRRSSRGRRGSRACGSSSASCARSSRSRV